MHISGFRDEKDLFLINVLGALILVIVSLPYTTFLRIIIGVPFILFFPGYALMCALFPKKKDLDEIERVALSIGLSISVVPLIGLLLNYTPFGIRLYPIIFSIFLFTFGLSLAVAFRRKDMSVEEKFAPSLSINVPYWGSLNKYDKALSVMAMAGVIVSTVFVIIPKTGQGFTEFYVLGPGGKIEDYPTDLTLGGNGTVVLCVVNHEYGEVTYKLVIKIENETIGTINDITLGNETKWEQNFTFIPEKTGEKMKLEFFLFKGGVSEPYRSLHLLVTVKMRE